MCDRVLSVPLIVLRASLVVQWIKNPPAMQETQVHSLGWKDTLEKEMATYSNIVAWKIPWTEEPGGLQFMGVTRVGHELAIKPPPHDSIWLFNSSLIAQLVKNPLGMQETLVQFLGWEDPLEK